MATHLPTQPMPPEAARAASVNRRDVWRLAWQLLISNELLASAALGLAVLLLLTAILPQMPAGNLEAYARWLASIQNRFGALGAPLQTLGLFSITDTILFRVLIALTGCALAARGVEYTFQAWAGCTPPLPPDLPPSMLDLPQAQLVDLVRRRFRIREQNDYIVLDHFPLADAARLLVVLGGLVLIVGLMLTSTGGWRSEDLLISPGEIIPIGNRAPYALRLESLDENSGRIALLQETEPLAAGTITAERAFGAAGLAVQLQEIGPALRVQAVLSDVQPLDLLPLATVSPAPEVLLRFTAEEPDATVAAPEARLLVRLSFLPASQSFRAMLNRAPDGKAVFEGDLPADGVLRIENITFTFTPEKYARLVITHDPGALPALIGWIMSAVGMVGAVLWPCRRTWLRAVQENQTELIGDALPLPQEAQHG